MLSIGTVTMLVLTLGAAPETQPTAAASPATATGFLYKTVEFEGQSYAYSVYIPPTYTPDKAWPVVLALHGAGERGSDGLLQTEVGVGTAIRRWSKMIPAIVVMPQCPEKQNWIGPMGRMALKCVEAVSREYHCDANRVYLTGLSMGGQGAWHLAAALPDSFAAVIVVCGFASFKDWGGTTVDELAPKLTKTPVWVFHGDADQAVPVVAAHEMVSAVRKAGGIVYYTEYPGVGHNSWDKAYADPAMWKWLFEQVRGKPAARTTSQPADAQPAQP